MPSEYTREMMTFGAVSLRLLAVSLDGAALSVALPTLATALHTSASDLEWFWSGYLLLLAAAVLSPGRVRSTRGLIDADQQGWGDADAVAVMAAGRSALGLTERQCNRRVRERFSEGARILELGNVELRKGPMADAQARVPGAARGRRAYRSTWTARAEALMMPG